MKRLAVCSALCLLSSASAFAADAALPPAPKPDAPKGGFFVGLGGSYNSVNVDRDIFAVGVSDVSAGGALVARGFAEGPGSPFSDTQWTFAPEAQAGYFGQFGNSSWLWGAKFRYKYLDVTSTDRGVVIPQAGAFVPVGGGAPTTLTGNVLIQSIQTRVEHELGLLAFVGYSFANTNVYVGGGPAVFRTKSNIFRAVGFGDVNGAPTDITGAPISFSSSKWVWGAAGQIGMTYSFAPTWFLDVNYTYAVSDRYRTNYVAPFTSTSAGQTYVGLADITTSQRITSQAFAVSINKAF